MDVGDMLRSVSGGTPTPGGGAVGWIVLGQGVALLRMVSNLTAKSKKWESGHEVSKLILDATEGFEMKALEGFHSDCEAYESVVSAYKIPQERDDRQAAIESASLLAAEVPLRLMEMALEASLLHVKLAGYHNKNADSDLVSSGLLLKAAAVIGSKNVQANIPYLSPSDLSTVNAEHKSIAESLGKVIPIITGDGEL